MTRLQRRAIGLLLTVAFGPMILGCGGNTSAKGLPPTVPVSGIVTLDEKPLANATVVFVPTGSTEGIEAFGSTDSEGRYELQQLRGGKGVPAGEYQVVISKLVGANGQPLDLKPGQTPADVGAVEGLPARYSSATETQLKATVPAGGGEFPFNLKSDKSR